MKLEIKHLSSYLPYGLKCKFESEDFNHLIVGIEDTIDGVSLISPFNDYGKTDISKVKPILRPLSDLFKPIDWDNNNEPYMIGYKYGIEKVKEEGIEYYASEHYAEYAESPKCYIDITSFDWWLFEKHFDVFGLIEQNLAIDINTL